MSVQQIDKEPILVGDLGKQKGEGLVQSQVSNMGRRPRGKSNLSVEEASDQPPTKPSTQKQRPTRKRGRPRKTVAKEVKDLPEEDSKENVEEEEKSSVKTLMKKPRVGTEEKQQQLRQQKAMESSSSAAGDAKKAGGDTGQEEKPRRSGRRKGQPHKST